MEKEMRIGEDERNKNLGGEKKEKMKKNKLLATVEIAIVLCSVFLVLPAIAAASEIYEPGPLDVYGNANEDDTIDMRDTTYIKLVIFGKKPKTDLADANYDGKVSMLDVGQTKLIILGKEKVLTYIDIFGEAETVNKPIKRLANVGGSGVLVTRALGAMDILLPVVGWSREPYPTICGEISEWPAVGWDPETTDFEYILNLEPDALQTNMEAGFALGGEYGGIEKKRHYREKLPSIPLISLNMREPDVFPKNLRTYGYIIDRVDEAEEFSDWYKGYQNLYKARTDELSKDERPRVWFAIGSKNPYHTICPANRGSVALTLAGGRNIVEEIVHPGDPNYGSWIDVDPEWVVEQNPEFIFVIIGSPICSYETDDPSGIITEVEAISNLPGISELDAVKNGHVYGFAWALFGGGDPNAIIGPAYAGKLLHPNLFEDIDAQAVHQEFVDRFYRIDFNVREHGVFVYPPMEEW